MLGNHGFIPIKQLGDRLAVFGKKEMLTLVFHPCEVVTQVACRLGRADGATTLDGPRNQKMVGLAGFEPTTPCPPGRCATRLRYSPFRQRVTKQTGQMRIGKHGKS